MLLIFSFTFDCIYIFIIMRNNLVGRFLGGKGQINTALGFWEIMQIFLVVYCDECLA